VIPRRPATHGRASNIAALTNCLLIATLLKKALLKGKSRVKPGILTLSKAFFSLGLPVFLKS
jgi:hypothetical protein